MRVLYGRSISLAEKLGNLESPKQLLLIAVGTTTLLRLWFGYHFFGFHSGDDVEILRAGFMRAVDFAYEPWAVRNLLLSDILVSPIIYFMSNVGIQSVKILCWMSTFPFVLLASLNIILVYRLSMRWLKDEWAAAAASVFFAFHWIPLGYGSTVYPRTASTSCVLLAVLFIQATDRRRVAMALAGALLGLGFALRYSEVVFLVPAMILVLFQRSSISARVRDLVVFGGGFLLSVGIFVGLWDLVTWGRPFSSLVEFARFTLVEQDSSSLVKSQSFYWYLWRLPKWLPLTTLPFFFGIRRYRWLIPPSLFVIFPVAALSLVHHKEMRYLQGVIPFVAIALAGAVTIWWKLGRKRAVAILLVLSLASGVTYPSFLRRKSMAAVEAARTISLRPDLRSVAFSQPWAYGGNLFLPNGINLFDIGPFPTVRDIERAGPKCDVISVNLDRIDQSPEIEIVLGRLGFRRLSEFSWGKSRTVVVFAHEPP